MSSSAHAPASLVGRLAPSPTGPLHLGHAFSFLVAWWFARSRGGVIRLVMDDVDAERAAVRFEEDIQADLTWLGIDWDGKVVRSSEYLPHIRAQAEELLRTGRAFPCVCSRGDIRRANAQTDRPNRYPGTCRERFASTEEAEGRTGQSAGLRFLVGERVVEFEDGLRGVVRWDVAAEAGDFLVVRRDKHPAYQLGIVTVDQMLGVTEVVRGADLLESTARQVLLLEALGWPRPRYVHVPLVCDSKGKRLSKTEGSVALSELRAAGVEPSSIIRWAATCAGQKNPGSLETAKDLVNGFRSERLGREDIRLPVDPFARLR